MSLTHKLHSMSARHAEIASLMNDPNVMSDVSRFTRLSKEYADLDSIVAAHKEAEQTLEEIEEAELMLAEADSDPEMKQMAREELDALRETREKQDRQLKLMLLPKDPNDDKNVILEIRAGTGGEEAALFSADLFKMYTRYVESRNWKIEILSTNHTNLGGFKELIAMVRGNGVYSALKFESGVHRVQRVPTTEAGGRIHTSACTVAILPEATEVDIKIADKDLRIDVYRSSGPGGQSVNTTDSAVRITHIPTGLVVTCQDEKSQHKNKAKAMTVLQARLLDAEQQAADDQRSEARRSQVGSGDRSERIRTYNFPQGRVTDHRINLTLHKLDQVLQGDISEIIHALIADHQASLLSQLGEEA
ncbi:MAG: peptide chain release factor 1 [Magnetococcales bacterium]|nr:peptide chain release factor 1 [Magnetococcales bacterium]